MNSKENSRTAAIIAMAAFMIREGNAMVRMADWQERNYFSGIDHCITSA